MTSENPGQQPGPDRSETDIPPPPGAGRINSSRSGQSVSENPVLRAGRDAGDILANNVREESSDTDGDGDLSR